MSLKIVQRMVPVWRWQGGQASRMEWEYRRRAWHMGYGQDLENLEFPVQSFKTSRNNKKLWSFGSKLKRNSRAGNFTGGRRPSGDWSRGFPAVFHRSPRLRGTLWGTKEGLSRGGEDQESLALFLIQPRNHHTFLFFVDLGLLYRVLPEERALGAKPLGSHGIVCGLGKQQTQPVACILWRMRRV